MRKRRRLQPLPTAHTPPPVLPRRPLADFSAAERAQLLQTLRGYQAVQAAEDVAVRRRYVEVWKGGTALDDEDALLIASMPGAGLRAASPVLQHFLSALATWLPIKPPSTTNVRAALEREVATGPRWMLDAFLPVVEKLFKQIDLTRIQAGLIARLLATEPATSAFGTLRADAMHELVCYLQSRHPADIPPPPRIVAIFLWRALWKIDPDDARAVRVLMTEYRRRLRERGLRNPRGRANRPPKKP
jgi:hypothetical protein